MPEHSVRLTTVSDRKGEYVNGIDLLTRYSIQGEVFVLDDGGEVDLDLGNYERFLDIMLTRENNITTGKIYKSVIEREVRKFFQWLKSWNILICSLHVVYFSEKATTLARLFK